jgi:hypothetical protein
MNISAAKPFQVFNQAILLMLCTIALPVTISIIHRPRGVGSVSKPGLNRAEKNYLLLQGIPSKQQLHQWSDQEENRGPLDSQAQFYQEVHLYLLQHNLVKAHNHVDHRFHHGLTLYMEMLELAC